MSKPGRNALCPCGSGKKFKKCCIDQYQEKQYNNTNEKKSLDEDILMSEMMTAEEYLSPAGMQKTLLELKKMFNANKNFWPLLVPPEKILLEAMSDSYKNDLKYFMSDSSSPERDKFIFKLAETLLTRNDYERCDAVLTKELENPAYSVQESMYLVGGSTYLKVLEKQKNIYENNFIFYLIIDVSLRRALSFIFMDKQTRNKQFPSLIEIDENKFRDKIEHLLANPDIRSSIKLDNSEKIIAKKERKLHKLFLKKKICFPMNMNLIIKARFDISFEQYDQLMKKMITSGRKKFPDKAEYSKLIKESMKSKQMKETAEKTFLNLIQNGYYQEILHSIDQYIRNNKLPKKGISYLEDIIFFINIYKNDQVISPLFMLFVSQISNPVDWAVPEEKQFISKILDAEIHSDQPLCDYKDYLIRTGQSKRTEWINQVLHRIETMRNRKSL